MSLRCICGIPEMMWVIDSLCNLACNKRSIEVGITVDAFGNLPIIAIAHARVKPDLIALIIFFYTNNILCAF